MNARDQLSLSGLTASILSFNQQLDFQLSVLQITLPTIDFLTSSTARKQYLKLKERSKYVLTLRELHSKSAFNSSDLYLFDVISLFDVTWQLDN